MSFSASEPFRVLSGTHWGSGWRSQIFWRGWLRGQAALQSSSAILKQRHLEPCRAPGLPTNTSVVSSLLEDIPKASQDYFCFLIIISYWQVLITQPMPVIDLRCSLLVSWAEGLDSRVHLGHDIFIISVFIVIHLFWSNLWILFLTEALF